MSFHPYNLLQRNEFGRKENDRVFFPHAVLRGSGGPGELIKPNRAGVSDVIVELGYANGPV